MPATIDSASTLPESAHDTAHLKAVQEGVVNFNYTDFEFTLHVPQGDLCDTAIAASTHNPEPEELPYVTLYLEVGKRVNVPGAVKETSRKVTHYPEQMRIVILDEPAELIPIRALLHLDKLSLHKALVEASARAKCLEASPATNSLIPITAEVFVNSVRR